MTDIAPFLDEVQLGPAIKQLMKGGKVRCAVAFWGVGANKALFGRSHILADARVICDVSMGGSNPQELKALGAPDNVHLRHIAGLHAKMYLSNRGMIVGSANASGNGLGFLNSAKLIEAGTFNASDDEACRQGCEWFEQLWERATQVDWAALELAGRTWRKSSGGAMPSARINNPKSLLDTVIANPDAFRGVGFAFTQGNADTEQRDEAAEGLIEDDDRNSSPLLSRLDRRAIAAWKPGDLFSEWDPQDISAWPQRFVCAHMGRAGKIGYWFYERVYTVVLPQNRGMVLARRSRTLRSDLGFKHGRETMASADRHRLNAIFDYLGEDEHRLYESGEKLTTLCDDVERMRDVGDERGEQRL